MNKEKLIELGLSDELAEKVAAASADELKGFIPKHRFDEVNEAKKAAEEQVKERDQQLTELGKKAKDSEELTKTITELQEANKNAQAKYEADIKAEQVKGAVERALIEAGAKNTKAVKALLDLDNAELDGDAVKGLADQLKKLQESEDSKFLFNSQGPENPQFKGAKPIESSGQRTPGADLQAQYEAAVKSGDMARVVMLKNQIHEQQNSNQ